MISTDSTPIRIIHFSDSHEPAVFETWRSILDKRSIGYFNSRFRRKSQHDPAYTERAVEWILQEKPHLAVFTGDATSTGQKSEFDAAWRVFKPLAESAIPLIYVPGNHDVYVKDPGCRTALRDFYEKMWNGKRQFSSDPFLWTLGPLRFAVIDSAVPGSYFFSCGVMNEKSIAFLKEAVRTKTDKSPLIYVGHFPLHWNRGAKAWRHGLRGASEIMGLLEERKIDLSLCGHIHAPMEELDAGGRGEIIAGSVSRYHCMADIFYDRQQDRFTMKRIKLD